MKKIGTKNTSKAKYRGTAYKCDLCGRKFMSLDALKSHQRSVHNLQPDKSRVKQYGKQAKKPEVKEKVVKKAAVMEPTITPLRTTRAKPEKGGPDPPKTQVKTTKTVEFECPKCFKSFHSYILASRHIQKFHCVDKKGSKVSPHNAIIIQPERKELCLKCNRKVKSIPSHICGIANKMMEEEGLIYNCTACETTFNNKRTFYTHVVTSHPDGVESLFFPTNTEFMKWKEEMEAQTNTKYSELDKFDSKCFYHCDYQSGNAVKASINICPSVIVIQEFTKGIQVHYYKKHYKHGTKDYKLLNKYKKFSITAFLKSSDSYFDLTDIKYDDNDMYVQFKKLMESIVLDAAKLKTDSLTILFGKALEMTTILTGYDDDMSDDGAKPMKRNMTDSQIVKALEESTLNNENVEEYNEPDAKKLKKNIDESEAPSPMILNSFSLADNTIKENSKSEPTEILSIKVKDITTLRAPNESKENVSVNTKYSNTDVSKTDTIPASFNQSYAEFLEKNFPDTEAFGKRRSDRRNVMKTKIGQYKPPSPKKVLLTMPKLIPTTMNNNEIDATRKLGAAVENQNKRKLITPSTQDKHRKQANSTPTQDKERKQANSTSTQDKERKQANNTPTHDKERKQANSTSTQDKERKQANSKSTQDKERKQANSTSTQDKEKKQANSTSTQDRESKQANSTSIQDTKRKSIRTPIQNSKFKNIASPNPPIQNSKLKNIATTNTPIQNSKLKNIASPNPPIQNSKLKNIATTNTPIQTSKLKNIVSPNPETKRKPITPIQDTKVIKSKPRTLDIEYEVKEREDDCNILILKI